MEKLTNSSVPMAAKSQRDLTVSSKTERIVDINWTGNVQRNMPRLTLGRHQIMFKHSAGDEAWLCKHCFVWNCSEPRGRTWHLRHSWQSWQRHWGMAHGLSVPFVRIMDMMGSGNILRLVLTGCHTDTTNRTGNHLLAILLFLAMVSRNVPQGFLPSTTSYSS